jgi:hypothetical protein
LFVASAICFNILIILVWFGTAGHHLVFLQRQCPNVSKEKLSAQQVAVQINSGGKG